MTNTEKRQQLIIWLADAEDEKVNALYTLMEGNLNEHSYDLTDEHARIVEERHQNYLNGTSKPSPWQEVHDRVRNKRKRA